MQHLIADMLFLARSDAGGFPVVLKSCQPDLLLLDAYEKFDLPIRQKGLTLRLKLPEGQLPLCRCDPERVAQVLSVLLDNAISYTPSGDHALPRCGPPAFRHTLRCCGYWPGHPEPRKTADF